MQKSLTVFISYADEDETLRRELDKHLSLLKEQDIIKVWHYRQIQAGEEWENKIYLHINAADLILLLISPDFMASRYCYGIEMKRAIERHTRGEARVIPIILRPIDWQVSPLGDLQALPKNAEPIILWQNRDAAFLDVTKGIRSVAEEILVEQSLHSLTYEHSADPNLTSAVLKYPQQGEYQRRWSRGSRGLMLIVLDQSESMNEMMTLGERTATLAEITTSFANALIQEVIDCSGWDYLTALRRDTCDVAAFGYSNQVMPLLNRTGSPIPLPELAEASLGSHSLFQYRYNPVKGQVEKFEVRLPYWIRPYVGGTQNDMAAALRVANQVVQSWINADDTRRVHSPAPLLLHITGARYLNSSSNPIEEATRLQQIRTNDGAALLFNYYFAPSTRHFLVFPHDIGQLENLGLSDEERFVAEQLFHMSSIVPYTLAKNAASLFRKAFPFDARGSLYNADGATVIDLLSWGTRADVPRRWSRDVDTWPITHQYDEALQHADMTVYDQDIRYSPLLKDGSGPIHLNAKKSYVCVYRLGDWIVKCFVGNPPVDIGERYWAIHDYINLHRAQLPFLISQEWIRKGVRINRQDWPFIKSPYIRHIPLGAFLKNIVLSQDGDRTLISRIARQWLDIITTFESLNIAHGDLDLTNVLVCGISPNITLGLIDFDCMYVPMLAGRQPWEQGHEHFQPIQSELRHFNNEMDRFSALNIYLSLIALAEDPLLWETCNAHEDDKLLLGTEDFRDLENSSAYQLLCRKRNNQELQKCLAELAISILESRMPRSLPEVLHSPEIANASTVFGFMKLSTIPTIPSQLPILFPNDPLYATPRPAKSRLFIYTKGNAPLENCESAYAFSPDETRFALSEGNGAFARTWSALLSRLWVEQPFVGSEIETFHERLHELRKDWEHWIYYNWLPSINKRNRNLGRREFSQYDAERYIAQGASATLLGVVLDQTKTTWSAFATGDTCLFYLSRKATSWEVRSFPQETSMLTSGSTSPLMSHSIDTQSPIYQQMSEIYASGDVLLLVTNELARWLLRQAEQRSIEWTNLLGLHSEKAFASFINQQRSVNQMNDEDTVLIIIPL